MIHENPRRQARVEAALIAADDPDWPGAPHHTLPNRLAYYRLPGVSIAVIHNGRIDWAAGYGLRVHGEADPVTPATRFQAAALSMPVAALAALRLVEAGALALDADIHTYLTNYRIPAGGWTPHLSLWQLLSHSGGVTPDYFPGYPRDSAAPTLRQVIDGAPPAASDPVHIDSVPGVQYRFSSGGYAILQAVIEGATGEPFADVARALVLDPLGMADSGFEEPGAGTEVAQGHHYTGRPVAGGWLRYPELAAAGLWSTPGDLARLMLALQAANNGAHPVLARTIADWMLEPLTEAAEGARAGLGVQLSGTGAALRFGHRGQNAGYTCELVGYVHSGRGAVVMTNGDHGAWLIQEVLGAVARVYDWPDFAPTDPDPTAAPPDPAFAGVYQLTPGFTLAIAVKETGMTARPIGQEPLPLIALGRDQYRLGDLRTLLIFQRGADGVVNGLTLAQNGVALPLRRLG